MKKYAVTETNGKVLYTTDDIVFFDSSVAVNYPLGNYMGMYEVGDSVVMCFENYYIVINK